MKPIQIYTWGRPNEIIKTINGEMPYSEYLDQQKKRLELNPNRIVKIESIQKPENKISLFASRYCEIEYCRRRAVKSIQTGDGPKKCCSFHIDPKTR